MILDRPDDWETVTVEDIAAPGKYSCVGGPFGSKLTRRDYVPLPGVPVIRGKNLGADGERFSPKEFVYVSEEKADELRQSLAFPGDVLFTQRGTLGQVGWIPSDLPFDRYVVSQSQMKLTVDRRRAEPGYVYSYFSTEEAKDYIRRNGAASGVPHINLEFLRRFPIALPPLSEQRAIADILGALDDKIELNRRTNRTLEAIAQAIFKSWFVDFDPVMAKADGREPFGMDAETAALFPDRFVESELGMVPEGWTPGSIATIARYVNGKNFTKNCSGTGRMVIRIAELNKGPGGSTKYNDVEADPDNTATPGDVLFAWSGSLGVYRWHERDALINQHIFKVICDEFPQWFVYFHLLEALPTFREIAAGKATTMGHIKRSHLSEVLLPAPKAGVLDAATPVIGPVYDAVLAHEVESRTLAELRDTLLPKLLSGEIRVRDAEKAAEQAL